MATVTALNRDEIMGKVRDEAWRRFFAMTGAERMDLLIRGAWDELELAAARELRDAIKLYAPITRLTFH
jgi:hypothetical protein